MAACTSKAASSSNHTRFDVFLSFRGEDTRNSFTDHLYAALKRAGVSTFRDNDDIDRGQDLGPAIVRAIEDSKGSVVVLSENYAKSGWCLEELQLILERRRNSKHFILPVFYGVDPSDMRNHRQSFAIEAKEGVEGSKWTVVNVNRWKSALTEVANLTGLVASGSEREFITQVVDTVLCKLDSKLVSTPAHITGMNARAQGIVSWLKNNQAGANFLAICAMGGSGKTTLAQYIFNSSKQEFESSSFLENIGMNYNGLLGLQKQLLEDILGIKDVMISSVSQGTRKIEEALHMKRVLIVLDDIDEHDKLGALLGTNAVHPQSKIIITTRLLDIDAWFGSISQKCEVYKLQLMNNYESLQLLSCHAFGSKFPLEGFNDLAVELAQYCGGNPLALKVLGSSLFVRPEDPVGKNSVIEIWRSRLNSLSSLKGDLDCRIQGVLRKSFDSLPLAIYKELFLHIAIFFVGEYEDYVVKILENDWHAKVGMMTLINRCLLTISPDKKLMMHQLLQDLGRNIVREESRDPAKHTRVWCSDEAYRVLTKGGGSKTIEGLALDARKIKKGTKALALKTSSLAKIDSLKLLQLKYVKLTGSYKNFPELRWLSWHGCHLEKIPSSLLMSSLVALDLTNGIFGEFEPPMVLNSLKILNLKDCWKLVTICKLSRLPNLETLILWNCSNLTHLCESIGGHQSLALLNLRGCKKLLKVLLNQKYVNQAERLKALCIGGGIPEQPLFSLPQSLKFLFLDLCDLEYNNDVRMVFHGQSLFGLSLHENPFEFLPSSIDLKTLRVLNLNFCENLKSILCLPSTLEELYTYGCTSLEKITFQSARFRLSKFSYGGCLRLSEIQGLFKLVSIAKLDESDLGDMKWVKAYQDHKVDLVGDEITKGRIWVIQMLYEYGIRSTYLQGIKDQYMMKCDYVSSSDVLFVDVPLDLKSRKIKGLGVTILYRSLGSMHKDNWILLARISNTTKGRTWIYNPAVYCKPRVDEDVAWLSYWPIGYVLDAGDKVIVEIMIENRVKVSWCGASLVYMRAGEVEQEENCENNTEMEEMIGGDLSEFEVTTGVYYLCRRDFFKSSTIDSLRRWFGDIIDDVAELQGWRKSHQSQYIDTSYMELTSSIELNTDTLYKEIWLGYFNSESDIRKIKKVVSRLVGVDYVYYETYGNQLLVSGLVDCMAVETCVRECEKTVTILRVKYLAELLLKGCRKKIRLWTFAKNSPNAYYYYWAICYTKKEFF